MGDQDQAGLRIRGPSSCSALRKYNFRRHFGSGPEPYELRFLAARPGPSPSLQKMQVPYDDYFKTGQVITTVKE